MLFPVFKILYLFEAFCKDHILILYFIFGREQKFKANVAASQQFTIFDTEVPSHGLSRKRK